jgi:hypothetical protein
MERGENVKWEEREERHATDRKMETEIERWTKRYKYRDRSRKTERCKKKDIEMQR